MNKADLERALKKTTGAALKRVVVTTDHRTLWDVESVTFDERLNVVVINIKNSGISATHSVQADTNDPS